MKYLLLALLSLAAVLLFVPPPTALAHGGQPRLELGVERSNPGAAIELRGVDFEPEESIEIALIGPLAILLGTITADIEGGFLQLILLPSDLQEGAYHFRAVTDDHEVFSPFLTVEGIATEGEQGAQREQEEGLLGPMPTSLPPAAPGKGPAPTPASDPPVRAALLAGGVVIAALLGCLALRSRKSGG